VRNVSIAYVDDEFILKRVLDFSESILGKIDSPDYSETAWFRRLTQLPELLLYAEAGGEVVGLAFGRCDTGSDGITVGPVAVAPLHRGAEIGRKLLSELEHRAAKLGFHHLGLGAREEAEGFYLKCGYTPFLFIQARKPVTLNELRAINTKYDEVWSYEDDTDVRLMLMTPIIDKNLQHIYDSAFPGCSTQTTFDKRV
jgi:GNAT superfamily N-acetyltransferase